MLINDDILTSKLKRARSLNRHKQSFNIALLYGDKDDGDKLETYLSFKLYHLPASETLG